MFKKLDWQMTLNTFSMKSLLLLTSMANGPQPHVSTLGNMSLYPRVITPNSEPTSSPDDGTALSVGHAFNPHVEDIFRSLRHVAFAHIILQAWSQSSINSIQTSIILNSELQIVFLIVFNIHNTPLKLYLFHLPSDAHSLIYLRLIM